MYARVRRRIIEVCGSRYYSAGVGASTKVDLEWQETFRKLNNVYAQLNQSEYDNAVEQVAIAKQTSSKHIKSSRTLVTKSLRSKMTDAKKLSSSDMDGIFGKRKDRGMNSDSEDEACNDQGNDADHSGFVTVKAAQSSVDYFAQRISNGTAPVRRVLGMFVSGGRLGSAQETVPETVSDSDTARVPVSPAADAVAPVAEASVAEESVAEESVAEQAAAEKRQKRKAKDISGDASAPAAADDKPSRKAAKLARKAARKEEKLRAKIIRKGRRLAKKGRRKEERTHKRD
eukprot:TRINITY_DN1824_c0_g1_i1.p1 TRINITY_DN1824_c0_g1~~TRINITY_DN1824_c0_g1_i1.p1  ORF type:complete len:287 (-),score=57.11 TRINITY_DN1824_c0_g1_i1:709-1569(-)